MTKSFAILALSLTFLGGCANHTSIWRNEDAAGRIVAMDAQQRVVISSPETHETSTGKTTWMRYCPEPSPDAIASFAASLAAGISTSSQQASLQNSLATSVASVGLRTPTTQVIRDLITAACIADLNKSFDSVYYRDAFARNQQFVLAAHAIAVLGGDVAAGQSSASGSASQSPNAEASGMFDRFQKAVAARQKAEAVVAVAKGDAAAAAGDTKKAQDALDAKKKENSPKAEEIAALQKALDAKSAEQKQADADVVSAIALFNDAKAVEAAASKAMVAVSASTAMSASGSAVPGSVTFSSKGAPTDKAVDAIKLITLQVLSSGFTLDKCLDQLESIAKSKVLAEAAKNDLLERTSAMCTASVDARKQQLNLLLR